MLIFTLGQEVLEIIPFPIIRFLYKIYKTRDLGVKVLKFNKLQFT